MDVLTRIVVPGGARETWLASDLIGGSTASFSPAGLSNGVLVGDAYTLDSSGPQ
jgi:hypothetical protein